MAGWLVGWLAGCLAGLESGWFRLAGCLASWLAAWLLGCWLFAEWQTHGRILHTLESNELGG